MARLNDKKEVVVKKNPTKQKIVVAQGRALGNPFVPHKVLFTEIVADKETAKTRIKELQELYKDTDALSITYFSL